MGFLSRTFGGRKDEQPAATPSLDTIEAPSLPSSAPHLNIPEVPSGGVDFMKPPEDASKIYNPYAGLRNVGAGAHPAFRVSRQPEFVFQEEASTKRRSFSENIGFYTGVGYLSGAIGGGAVGLANGISQKPEGLNLTRRLLLNRLLNSSGQTGRMVGNTLGCLGLLFSVSESLSWWAYDEYLPYGPSWMGTVTAGALAGAIYRSPRGARASAITAVVGAAGASALNALRQINPSL